MFRKTLALLCAAALFFSGALAEMPVPESAGTDMIMGESAERYSRDVVLYYLAADGISLTPVRRTILTAAGEDIAGRLVEELLTPPGSADLMSVAPGDAKILDVETCRGLVTVNVSLDDAAMQEAERIVTLTSAICSTIMAAGDFEGVNVLINSVQEDVLGLPVGVMTSADTSIAASIAHMEAESQRFEAGADAAVRTAAVYFPSRNGLWMLPEMRGIIFEKGLCQDALIDALTAGPEDWDMCASMGASASGSYPEAGEVYVTQSGLRVMDIAVSGAYMDEMALQGIDKWQVAGAFVMTMCSFVPELDGVRLLVDGEAMTLINIKGTEKVFEDGVMGRGVFEAHVGEAVRLYFPDGNGRLKMVNRAMSARRADSAYAIMLQLISGPSGMDEGVIACMPEGVQAGDLLGVAVRGGVAIVNMSANFYRACQILDVEKERALVYSVVNTLCEMDGIDEVTILIEGERVETLANEIYLGTSLMPNPGIIAE